MKNFYEKMMDRGFLIYSSDGKFTLKKVPTPRDPRSYVTENVQADTSRLEFETFEDAVSYLKLIFRDFA